MNCFLKCSRKPRKSLLSIEFMNLAYTPDSKPLEYYRVQIKKLHICYPEIMSKYFWGYFLYHFFENLNEWRYRVSNFLLYFFMNKFFCQCIDCFQIQIICSMLMALSYTWFLNYHLKLFCFWLFLSSVSAATKNVK